MTTKDRQLNLRVSAEQRASLERAAELEGVSLSALVLRAAEERAAEVLRSHSSAVVPAEVFDRLLASLDEPVRDLAPSLQKAFDRIPAVVAPR